MHAQSMQTELQIPKHLISRKNKTSKSSKSFLIKTLFLLFYYRINNKIVPHEGNFQCRVNEIEVVLKWILSVKHYLVSFG